MSVTLDWTSAPFVRRGKKFKLRLTVTTRATRKQTSLWWGLDESAGVSRQTVGFVLVRLAGMWLQAL
jgi:hypothetical protein